MSKSFKKFNQYIKEESEEKSDSSHDKTMCDRCGEQWSKCKCYDEDYYDAKLPHYTPKGETKKGKNHG